MTEGWVLVGIDGGEAGEAAVEYAARYAARRGLGLKLLHVAPEIAYTVAVAPDAAPTGVHHRHEMVDTALARARALMAATPDLVVADIAFGGRVDRLLWSSTGCELVVLGDQRRPQLDRLATGSVLAGVAARCPVPVIGVPAGWVPSQTEPLVVAAVKSIEHSDALLEQAVATAADLDGRLRVLHARPAWRGAPGHRTGWETAARAGLADLVAAHVGDRSIPVEIEVIAGQPAQLIVDASKDADLLLLTRRPFVYPHGHLGGTGRAVLRESRCPVAVLPPSAAGPRATD